MGQPRWLTFEQNDSKDLQNRQFTTQGKGFKDFPTGNRGHHLVVEE